MPRGVRGRRCPPRRPRRSCVGDDGTAVPRARTRAASGSVDRTGRPAVPEPGRRRAGLTGRGRRASRSASCSARTAAWMRSQTRSAGPPAEVRARRVTAALTRAGTPRRRRGRRRMRPGAPRRRPSANVSVTASIASVCRRRASFDHLQTCSERDRLRWMWLFTVPRGWSSRSAISRWLKVLPERQPHDLPRDLVEPVELAATSARSARSNAGSGAAVVSSTRRRGRRRWVVAAVVQGVGDAVRVMPTSQAPSGALVGSYRATGRQALTKTAG